MIVRTIVSHNLGKNTKLYLLLGLLNLDSISMTIVNSGSLFTIFCT